eukprot:GDKJ01024938.1.p1 GENE.GDKJ01024938.1~~GDKJ01024938.1.p1  ORF type:complete len:556 (-),score=147.66 GDKJ01024938.1:59-1609(-)
MTLPKNVKLIMGTLIPFLKRFDPQMLKLFNQRLSKTSLTLIDNKATLMNIQKVSSTLSLRVPPCASLSSVLAVSVSPTSAETETAGPLVALTPVSLLEKDTIQSLNDSIMSEPTSQFVQLSLIIQIQALNPEIQNFNSRQVANTISRLASPSFDIVEPLSRHFERCFNIIGQENDVHRSMQILSALVDGQTLDHNPIHQLSQNVHKNQTVFTDSRFERIFESPQSPSEEEENLVGEQSEENLRNIKAQHAAIRRALESAVNARLTTLIPSQDEHFMVAEIARAQEGLKYKDEFLKKIEVKKVNLHNSSESDSDFEMESDSGEDLDHSIRPVSSDNNRFGPSEKFEFKAFQSEPVTFENVRGEMEALLRRGPEYKATESDSYDAARLERLRAVGRFGEEYVYHLLKSDSLKYADVKWINENSETALPYDVTFRYKNANNGSLSKIQFAEVKATSSLDREEFEISANEWKFAANERSNYHIFRVFGVGQGTGSSLNVVTVSDPFHQWTEKRISLKIAL